MLTLMYGGTFDPIHCGHLAVARGAAAYLRAEVRLVPAADPPHRQTPHASAEHRAQMVTLAIAGERGLALDRREMERKTPSYTIQTVLDLRDELGDSTPIGLLLGADAFLGLPSWHLWRELLPLVHLVVVNRPGYPLLPLSEPLAQAIEGHWTRRPEDLRQLPAGRALMIDIGARSESSTRLRECLAGAGDWASMVPESVADYIRSNHLYGV